MNDGSMYNELLRFVDNMAGGKVSAKNIEDSMNAIAYHESARTMDPFIKQKVFDEALGQNIAGPGRGIFQYEMQPSEKFPKASGAGTVALQRTYNFFSKQKGMSLAEMPDWIKSRVNSRGEVNVDVDASELSTQQQKIMFLADKYKDEKVVLADLGNMYLAEWWSKYHHKGEDSNILGFAKDQAAFLISGFFK